MDAFDLLIDLHLDGDRQGPGGTDQTLRAIDLAGLRDKPKLAVADIGCGSGASTLDLARTLDAHITAVDLFPAFLERLNSDARDQGLADRVTTQAASMDALTFEDASLDVIWSEGAIYNIGFETGIQSWRQFLKPGGILAVSELTWLTAERPAELTEHWAAEYSEVATASVKMAQLETHGYGPVGYFPLPKTCWLDNYYRPLQARFGGFLGKYGHSDDAEKIVEAEKAEIGLYEQFSDYVSYGFYIARRLAD